MNKIKEPFYTTIKPTYTPLPDTSCEGLWEGCTYDETEHTENRTKCLEKCKSNKNCSSSNCFYKCFDEKCSKWTSYTCEFNPYGATLDNCTNKCIEMKGCNYKNCYEKCSNCNSEKDCLWYKKKINEEEIFIKENIPANIDPSRPIPPTIFVKVKKDGVVTIKLNPPFTIKKASNISTLSPKVPEIDTDNIDTKISSFMYVLYKTHEKTGGIRVGTYYIPMDTSSTSMNYKIKQYNEKKGPLPIIEFDIENLDKNTFYNIGIRSYRDDDSKISPLSNIFTVIPNKEKKHNIPKLTRETNGNNMSGLSQDYKPHVCSPTETP